MAYKEMGLRPGKRRDEVPSPMAGGSAAARRETQSEMGAGLSEEDLFADLDLGTEHAVIREKIARAHRNGGMAEVVDMGKKRRERNGTVGQPEQRSEQAAAMEREIDVAISRLVELFKEGGDRELVLSEQARRKDPQAYRDDANRLENLMRRTKDELAKMGGMGRLVNRFTGRTAELEGQLTAWRREHLQAVREAKVAERLQVLAEIEEGLTRLFHLLKSLPQVQEKFPFAELYSRGVRREGGGASHLRVRVRDWQELLAGRGSDVGSREWKNLSALGRIPEEDDAQDVA